MLRIHQPVGLALVVAMATTMVSGQLHFSDRFGAAASGRGAQAPLRVEVRKEVRSVVMNGSPPSGSCNT